MVVKKSASRPQLNALTKLTRRRTSLGNMTSRASSNSLSSTSSNSLTKWHRLDNPLVSLSLRGSFIFDQRRSFRSRRRRRRKSSKNSDSNEDTYTDTERDTDSCFDSFGDIDLEEVFVLHTKSGTEVKVKFGHDYLSVDGRLVLYEHIIYWGHSSKCLRISYVENMATADQNRVDLSLYPSKKESVTAGELAHVLQTKVAALYKEVTGCSESEAAVVATKSVAKSEVKEVLNQVDQTSELRFVESFTQDI